MLKNQKIKISSNRNFGIVFSIVFLIIAFWPLLNSNEINYWSLAISITFLILGLTNSKILTPLNKIWFNFGLLLGNVIAPIVMGIIFFLVITPIGIVLQLFRKDVLRIKIEKSIGSYWILRKYKIGTMKNQF